MWKFLIKRITGSLSFNFFKKSVNEEIMNFTLIKCLNCESCLLIIKSKDDDYYNY